MLPEKAWALPVAALATGAQKKRGLLLIEQAGLMVERIFYQMYCLRGHYVETLFESATARDQERTLRTR